jgi:hypothetical protein
MHRPRNLYWPLAGRGESELQKLDGDNVAGSCWRSCQSLVSPSVMKWVGGDVGVQNVRRIDLAVRLLVAMADAVNAGLRPYKK